MASAFSDTLNLQRLARGGTVINGVVLLGILGLMMLPIPTPFIDVLLTFNITFALVILMMTIYLKEPLEFSVFPSLLLMVTLFRLAMNVASTRLILSNGYAGEVISSFGNFVVGGNYVIGLVIFIILIIIQFVVITKGSGRIAEVAARFTLDAMPGKQMAIDADLNAGLINEIEAKERRGKISREADFYGAMDGASKFVRGDAIAGIIITLVNILGGLLIGMMQRGLPLGEALQTYTLLTVGDGLVTQMPALMVSTAAGMVVTRSAGRANLGEEFATQLLTYPRTLLVSAICLFSLGLVPGLPTIPFMVVSVACAVVFYLARKATATSEADEDHEEQQDEATEPLEDDDLFCVDPLELEVGYGLIPLVDKTKGGDLLKRLTNLRRQYATDFGIHISPIRIRDNVQLRPNQYVIKLKGAEIASGRVYPDHLLAMNSAGRDVGIIGIETEEPVFGLPAVWIRGDERDEAEVNSYTIVEPEAVIATHLSEVVKKNADEIMTRQDVKDLLDKVKKRTPAVVDDLIPDQVSVGFVQRVLANLLREQVPIKDMTTILETISNFVPLTKDVDVISERVREALARTISRRHATRSGEMNVLTLDPQLEDVLVEAVKSSERSGNVIIDPNFTSKLLKALAESTRKAVGDGHEPVVICSSHIRLFLKRLVETTVPNLFVISFNEISRDVKVKSIGTVKNDV